MKREDKIAFVESFGADLKSAAIVIAIKYKGVNVAGMNALRSGVRDAGAKLQVAKNRLVKLAIVDTDYAMMADLFEGQTAIAISDDDPIGVAKALVSFAKENENLKITGAGWNGDLMDEKQVIALSKMPSLDELRAKIISIVQTPATRIAGVLQAPAGQVARVCGAYGSSS